MSNRPETTRELQERKQRMLAHPAVRVGQSIADAIVIKNQNLYFLTRPDGSAPLEGEHGFGLYYNDCRYLSGYSLRLGGQAPNVLVAHASPGYMAIFELTNPLLADGEEQQVAMDQLGITWRRQLDAGTKSLDESLHIENYGREQARFSLELAFRPDFRDVFALRGILPLEPGERHQPEWDGGSLVLAYQGADELLRRLEVHFQPEPDQREGTLARFQIHLEPGRDTEIRISLALSESPQGGTGAARERPTRHESGPVGIGQPREDSRLPWLEEQTQIETDSLALNSILARSIDDLKTLETPMADDPGEGVQDFFAGGVPWYVALFGRDSILTALQTLAFDPGIAADTLRLLARYQAREVDAWREAQPGRILHELRRGELAHIDAIPHTPYYGSIDATPLFLILLGRHAAWSGSLDLFEELEPAAELALEWLDRYGDLDGDGYLEYDSPVTQGLINQGWKDSGNGILHADGSLPQPPIALVEVQGYAYRAKREMAALYRRAGKLERAAELEEQARALDGRFNQDFWCEEIGCYALALDGNGDPLHVVSSNAGHSLWSGIADEDKARRTVQRLMRDDMFSGWGVRTVSATHDCYNPTGYHQGTVWPHDNAILANGYRRYGFDRDARRILRSIVQAAIDFEDHRLPELFAGFSREQYQVPVRYPVACHPQAWAAGTVPYLLTTILGLEPEAFDQRLRLVRPGLPDYVDRLQIRGLRVGQGKVDLNFERTASGHCAVEVLGVEGDVDVLIDAGRATDKGGANG